MPKVKKLSQVPRKGSSFLPLEDQEEACFQRPHPDQEIYQKEEKSYQKWEKSMRRMKEE